MPCTQRYIWLAAAISAPCCTIMPAPRLAIHGRGLKSYRAPQHSVWWQLLTERGRAPRTSSAVRACPGCDPP